MSLKSDGKIFPEELSPGLPLIDEKPDVGTPQQARRNGGARR
jgi:hypothetical protein